MFKRVKRRSLYLTMPDGVKLAVDVYLPRNGDGKKLPAILAQTRYYRSLDLRWPFKMFLPDSLYWKMRRGFLARGYAWVSVDVRGTGASFGRIKAAFSREQVDDAGEIVDWIASQPWSNGQVGGYGASYDGICAELLLALEHPAVRAVMPAYAPFDLYEDIAFPGGLFLSWFFQSWGEGNRVLDRNELHRAKGLLRRLALRGVSPVGGDRSRTQLRQAVEEHVGNWDPYETLHGVTFRDDRVAIEDTFGIDDLSPHVRVDPAVRRSVPVYSYSGWFDASYARAAVRRFLFSSATHHWLTLGPWDHGGFHNDSPTRRCRSRYDHTGDALRFFDCFLMGAGAGNRETKPVRYYTMVEDRWKASATWPPEGTRMRSYYLTGSNRLDENRPAETEGFDVIAPDPSAGTGKRSRWRTLTLSVKGARLYTDRKRRDPELLCYTSGPLEQDLEVTGHPVLHLFVSADQEDAALFVYLEDVDRRGRVTMVTEGQIRALHRKLESGYSPSGTSDAAGTSGPAGPISGRSFRRRDGKPLVPGETVALIFDLIPTSYLFRAAHSIRIALSGGDVDHFEPLPGEPPEIHVHRSRAAPSRVDLPVVASRA
jgi:putative CocE/NonD family hydrolase